MPEGSRDKQIDFSFLFSSSRGERALLSPLKWPLQTTRLYYLNFLHLFASSFSFATGNPKGPESLGVFLYISWWLLSLPLLERIKIEKRRQTDRFLRFGWFSQTLVKRKSHLTMSYFPWGFAAGILERVFALGTKGDLGHEGKKRYKQPGKYEIVTSLFSNVTLKCNIMMTKWSTMMSQCTNCDGSFGGPTKAICHNPALWCHDWALQYHFVMSLFSTVTSK